MADPVCTACGKNRVPKHVLPVKPLPPVCDECQRAGITKGGASS